MTDELNEEDVRQPIVGRLTSPQRHMRVSAMHEHAQLCVEYNSMRLLRQRS